MDTQAELLDDGPLQALAQTMAGLPKMLARALDCTENDAGPRLRRLERAIDEARWQVQRAEAALESVDYEDGEGDYDAAAAYLEAARAHLARLEAGAQRVEEALTRYRSAALDLRETERRTMTQAHSFLLERLTALRAYDAVRLEGGGRSAPQAASTTSVAEEDTRTPVGRDLYNTPLPAGFEWVPIAEIHTHPTDPLLAWKSAGEAERMRIGLQTFARDLSPLLRSSAHVDPDLLLAFDREHGRQGTGVVRPDSLSNIFEVFLRSDPIAVSPDGDRGYTFSNGRHRTEIARGLGWTHVPAKVLKPHV
jgi:hypothetical protein